MSLAAAIVTGVVTLASAIIGSTSKKRDRNLANNILLEESYAQVEAQLHAVHAQATGQQAKKISNTTIAIGVVVLFLII